MQSVFVSGSATGIGAGLVSKLLREGWQVFAGYRSSPPEAASWYGDPHVERCQLEPAIDSTC